MVCVAAAHPIWLYQKLGASKSVENERRFLCALRMKSGQLSWLGTAVGVMSVSSGVGEASGVGVGVLYGSVMSSTVVSAPSTT